VLLREQAVAALRRNLGTDHKWTLDAEMKFAVCLQTLGRAEEADPLLSHVVAVDTRAHGISDPAISPRTQVTGPRRKRYCAVIGNGFL